MCVRVCVRLTLSAPHPPPSCAGAEFWSAFFFTGTIAIPIVFYSTHFVGIDPDGNYDAGQAAGSLVLALAGIFLAILGVVGTAICQRREEADAYGAW